MAKRPTVTTLSSGFNSTETLNSNFNNIAASFDNTLSLDGSTPNALGADLDLNSNKILNASAIYVGGADVFTTISAAETATAASAAAALVSENAASASEGTSSTKAGEAAASAAAALVSKNAASVSEGTATTKASEAVASASTATTKASEAVVSAATATTKAGEAVTSASTATTKAGESTTSASEAAASASASEAAKDAALAAFDSFDDRYLGQKATDPTTDNDGDPLVAGMLYFNTVADAMKVYDGSAWVAAYASLSGALLAVNNLSDLTVVATARTNLGLASVASSGVYTDLTSLPTLGTAAATASTDYATAAQGVLAGTAVQASSTTGSAEVPTGTTAQRDGTPAAGYLRFNSTDTSFEGYDGSAWGSIGGGATGGGSDSIFYENSQTVTTSYTVTATTNAMTAGPITINAGATVTVDTGGRWVVV